jgi:diguanylate cyclase (GGDEF)-like protein
MNVNQDRSRVLVVSSADAKWSNLFSGNGFTDWELVLADSFARAMLVQQSNACDILLADQTVLKGDGLDGLIWLLKQQHTLCVILVGDFSVPLLDQAYQAGVSFWLPQERALQHPSLVSGILRQAQRWIGDRRANQRCQESLEQSHKQVDRLVSLLWRTGQLDLEKHWYTYRHMLERLDEELARARRHQLELSVALGETEPVATDSETDTSLMGWTAEQITYHKRRSDVVGQYGLQGFMVLMTHTPVQGGLNCCQRLKSRLEVHENAIRGPIKAVFGVAGFSPQVQSAEAILRKAEENLQAAKTGVNDGIVGE